MFSIQNRRYLGNKYKLLDFIEETVDHYCPDTRSIFDIFAGTGVVAYHFMDKMKVITNDTLYSNYLAHLTFMSNTEIDKEAIGRYIKDFNSANPVAIDDNYMSETFGNTYFSIDDCKKIGFIRERIAALYDDKAINEREMAILITSLLYAMDKIANTCGHYDAYRQDVTYSKHLELCCPDISKKPYAEDMFFNEDSNELIKVPEFPFVDCVYCDPPYNSRNYCDLYHVLENVALWKKPEVVGVAKKMDRSSLKSRYCTRTASSAFEDLVSNLKCKYIVLSYNNTGNTANDRSNARMSDDDIMKILSSKGEVTICSKKYKAFTTGKSDNTRNEERLFVCKVK